MPHARRCQRPQGSSLLANLDCRKTDDVLRKTGLTSFIINAGPPETHRVFPTSDGEELLQEWAKKAGPPNLLEVDVLSKYLDVDVWDVYDWCQYTGNQHSKAQLTTSQSKPKASRRSASI